MMFPRIDRPTAPGRYLWAAATHTKIHTCLRLICVKTDETLQRTNATGELLAVEIGDRCPVGMFLPLREFHGTWYGPLPDGFPDPPAPHWLDYADRFLEGMLRGNITWGNPEERAAVQKLREALPTLRELTA